METTSRTLSALADSPVVALIRAVAVAIVDGPRAGLDRLAEVESDQRIAGDHRLPAVRAQLLEQLGDREGALAAYDEAARRTRNAPQRRYLCARAERLRGEASTAPAAGET